MSGHGLRFEGAAFDDTGHRLRWHGTGGEGRAMCACGAFSEWLHSGAERKRWHKEHKAQAPQETEVVDLVAALRASVEAAKKRREEAERKRANLPGDKP